MGQEDIMVIASRVMLLDDGLIVLATIPDDLYSSLIERPGEVEITVVPMPGKVAIHIGCVMVDLPPDVFQHLVDRRKVWVYLSGYNNYVMKLWVSGEVVSSDMWAAKGVADYLGQSQ